MPSAITPTGEKYAYGYGRIGVLQQRLLSQGDIDRLLAAKTDRELRQVLGEVQLTAPVMPREDLHDIVPLLEKWLRTEVENMAPTKKRDVFHILWMREDIPAIAYYLKKFHGFTSELSKEPLEAVTAYDVKSVRALALEGAKGDLPVDLVQFVEGIKNRTGISPQEIDGEVARFIARKQVRMARKSGSRLVKRYVSHLIDLQNIRTIRRLKPEERSPAHFVEGGELSVKLLLDDSADLLLKLVEKSSLPDSLTKSLAEAKDSSVLLERALNKGLAHDIAAMRAVPLSIEPLVAFAIIALSHILLVRTILIGKAAHLSAEDIATLLPPFFSTSFAAA